MVTSTLRLHLSVPIANGERRWLYASGEDIPADAILAQMNCPLTTGMRLVSERGDFIVERVGWLPGSSETASVKGYLLCSTGEAGQGELECVLERPGYTLAWITMSDKGAQGKRVDESGPIIGKMVDEKLGLALIQGFVIPDEADQLKGLLMDLALNQGIDLIMTTGGTGVGPRDVTPEATLAVIEKRLPGYEWAMTGASLAKTPHGAISRAVAGTLGQSLIVNMPGSPKAVVECLEPLLPTLKHTLEKLQGDPSDCAVLRQS